MLSFFFALISLAAVAVWLGVGREVGASNYRLWGPGLLDVSLIIEQQEMATPTQAPAQKMATSGMNLDVLSILQEYNLRKLVAER